MLPVERLVLCNMEFQGEKLKILLEFSLYHSFSSEIQCKALKYMWNIVYIYMRMSFEFLDKCICGHASVLGF